MNVFLSWSGYRSKLLAEAFREWLPEVIQVLKPWMSSEDIDKGARWSSDIASKLNNTKVGIICLTTDNLESPWILFEAGALSKTLEISLVCPYLLDLETTDLQGPLVQFQATKCTKDDTKKLLLTINKTLAGEALNSERLNSSFERCWPSFENRLKEIQKIKSDSKFEKQHRTDRDILEEVLERTRWIEKNLSPTKSITKFSDLSALEFIQTNWNTIVDQVKRQKIALGSFLSEGIPSSLQDNVLVIKFNQEEGFHKQSVERNKKLIEQIIEETTGYTVHINCQS